MGLIARTIFSDPDAFTAHMADAAPGLSVRPLTGDHIEVDQSLALLPRTAIFRISTTNLVATIPGAADFWGINIPIRGGFAVGTGPSRSMHSIENDEIHLLHADRDLCLRARDNAKCLSISILSTDLHRKIRALTGKPPSHLAEIISARSQSGSTLARFAQYFWSELQQTQGLWTCPTAMAEMEDCLASLLALAISATHDDTVARPGTVRRAEDFLIQHLTRPVTRSELAETVNVSISTLSRGFRECHGVGPMAWLRTRRLEAARNELQAAEPGETNVTETALRYGFEHLGRFLAEYLRAFGEKPSSTLKR